MYQTVDTRGLYKLVRERGLLKLKPKHVAYADGVVVAFNPSPGFFLLRPLKPVATWNISTAGLPASRWSPADIVEVGPGRLVVDFGFFDREVYYVEKRKYAVGVYNLYSH